MRHFPFASPALVSLSAFLIIIVGFLVLGFGFLLDSETETTFEQEMDDSDLTVNRLPDVSFDTEVSVELVFDSPDTRGNVTLYFVDKENHDEFMEWVETEGPEAARDKLPQLELIYQHNCSTSNDSFSFMPERDSELYLIMVSQGGEHEFTVIVVESTQFETGVCCIFFLMLVVFGGLVLKAGLRLKQRPQVYNYHYRFDRKFNY